LIIQCQLGDPGQHIEDDQVFDNRRETVGPGESNITHGG